VGELRLEALLTDDGQRIEQGLVWHVFEEAPVRVETAGAKPKLVGTWREAAPVIRLPPGTYHVTAGFGRAHLTRKIVVRSAAAAPERFVLNAGGLRISARLANGEPVPETAFAYEVLSDEPDQSGGRTKVFAGDKPGLIIRLNAGIYQIVSTYGDANSIVRSDVSVEAGKLTEATITHHSARVTFKLVTRAGGEALADTQWTLLTAQGDRIRESEGALPSHVLAAGAYEVIARHGGGAYRRSFQVEAGSALQVEIVITAAAR
jgi:hypothetical protein